MNTSLHDLVIRTFATVEAKDLDAMTSLFADDAVVIDPTFRRRRCKGKRPLRKTSGKRWLACNLLATSSSTTSSPRTGKARQ